MKNLKTFAEFVSESQEFDPAKTTDIDVLLPAIKSASDLMPGKEYVINLDGKTHANMMYQGVSDGNYIFNSEDMKTTLNLNAEQINGAVSVGGVQRVNESKSYKGREVLPNWINPSRDFGAPVSKSKDLKPGAEYILWEPGMDVWQAEWIYQGYTGGKHIFNDSNKEADPMVFTQSELEEYITSGDVIKQN